MLMFLLYTILALVANASLVKILHISIQPGQWIDMLFGYQKRLQQWDLNGNILLSKIGGNCEVCFSHILTFIGYWLYMLFMNTVADVWITDTVDNWFWVVFGNVLWYLLYVSIGSMLSLYFITKLFAK